MKKIIRKFLLISIVLSTTQSLEISFLPLSLFQIFLILLFIFCFIDIIQKRKITRGDYIYFTIICLVSSILAYFTSLNTLWAKSYMLSGIMISGIIFSICKYFTNQDLPILQKSLIRSQYLTLFFSIYNMYFFYVKKEVVKYINIGFLSVVLDDAFIKRASVSGQLRLSLPYATPPILSIVMSMCICILLFNKNLYSKVLRIFLLIFFSIVLIFTMSRTGVISLIFALFIYFIKDLKKLIKISNIFIFLIFIFIFLLLFNKSIYLNKFINRFNINNIIQDRHFLVPVDGIIIWLSSLKNFVLGIWFGSSSYIQGKYTYLPPYFLNIYVTLLAERGLLGLIMVIFLINLSLKGLKQIKKSIPEITSIWICFFNALIAGLFYENFNCFFVVTIIAICFMLTISHFKKTI